MQVDTDIQRVTAENGKHLQHWQENLLKLQKLDATIKVNWFYYTLCTSSLYHQKLLLRTSGISQRPSINCCVICGNK